MISFILGIAGSLIALIGWFGFHSVPALIVGTVLYIIETILISPMLQPNAYIADVMIFVVGGVISTFIGPPFYVGGMIGIAIYSAILTITGAPYTFRTYKQMREYRKLFNSALDPAPSYENEIKCPHCGAAIVKDATFCNMCGESLESKSESENTTQYGIDETPKVKEIQSIHETIKETPAKPEEEKPYSERELTDHTVDQVKRWKKLLDDGIITQDEFIQKKKELLDL